MNTTDMTSTPAKPAAGLLVLLNFLALLAYCVHGTGGNPLALLFSLFAFVVLAVFSSIYYLILHFALRNRTLRNGIRITLYLLPITVMLLLSVLLPKKPPLANQTSPSVSPSGKYRMTMVIADNLWIVSIFNAKRVRLYCDDDSDFLGHLNVYWVWDARDRLWLYNSDDGRVWYWTPENNWTKTPYADPFPSFRPPDALYPSYASER